jgi:hypothetical protein
MLGGQIDRDAWAEEVDALVKRFDPGPRGEGNKSAFARRIGMTTKTLERWAARATDISPDSVRKILDGLQLSHDEQAELLTRVGYYVTGMPEPPAVPDPRDDPVVQRILADRSLTEEQRVELVQIQLDRIKADLDRRTDEYLRLRRLFGGQAEAS